MPHFPLSRLIPATLLLMFAACGSPPSKRIGGPDEEHAFGIQVMNQTEQAIEISVVATHGTDGGRHVLLDSLSARRVPDRIDPSLGAAPECLNETWCSLGPGPWTLEVREASTGWTQRISIPGGRRPRWLIAVIAGGAVHLRLAELPIRLA